MDEFVVVSLGSVCSVHTVHYRCGKKGKGIGERSRYHMSNATNHFTTQRPAPNERAGQPDGGVRLALKDDDDVATYNVTASSTQPLHSMYICICDTRTRHGACYILCCLELVSTGWIDWFNGGASFVVVVADLSLVLCALILFLGHVHLMMWVRFFSRLVVNRTRDA